MKHQNGQPEKSGKITGRRIKVAMPIDSTKYALPFFNRLFSPLTFLQKYLPTKNSADNFTEAPFQLARMSENPEKLLSASLVAKRLQKYGLIDYIKKNRRVYHDAPKLTSFQARSHKLPHESMGYGADFFYEEDALWRTLGEAQERALWRYVDYYSHKGIRASYKELSTSTLCINPHDLVGFTDIQKNEHACLQFTADTVFHWTKTTSLTAGKTVYCPTQLLSNRYAREHCCFPRHINCPKEKEPLLRWCITTGLGTGQTPRQALIAGINEVIERDAFMSTYLNKLSPPQIDLEYLRTQDNELDDILSIFERYQLSIRVIKLVTDFPVHALGSIITDDTEAGPAIAIATNVEVDFRTALLGALRENMAVYFMARGVKMDKKVKADNPKTLGQKGRVKYWTDHTRSQELAFLYKNNTLQRPDIQSPAPSEREQLKILKKACLDNEQPAYYLDITKASNIKTGIHTTNVVMPGMHPLHLEESLPYFDTRRVHKVAKKCGYEPLTPLNSEPHPFP